MTDQRKLEKLFRQHYRQMYRLATMLLHDDAESKDVVHDYGKKQPSTICLQAYETDV